VGSKICYLYLMLAEDGLYKVGKTEETDSRRRELEAVLKCAGLQQSVTLVAYVRFMLPPGKVVRIEQRLLKHWKRHCRPRETGVGRTEWFDLPPEEVARFIALVNEFAGQPWCTSGWRLDDLKAEQEAV
jgi:hypothetical protein